MAEKTYKNISNVEQLGIEPGQTGKADIPEDQEQRMVAREAIEVVSNGDAPAPEKTPEEVEAEEKAAKEKADAEAAQAQAGRKTR